jgi:hypothetical protein
VIRLSTRGCAKHFSPLRELSYGDIDGNVGTSQAVGNERPGRTAASERDDSTSSKLS